MNFLKCEFHETNAVKGISSNLAEINSRTEALDEHDLYFKIKQSLDDLLVPNVALFKFYKLPENLEGNLLLILYLLNNTLDMIFEKLKKLEGPEDQIIEIPRIYDAQAYYYQCCCYNDWGDHKNARKRRVARGR